MELLKDANQIRLPDVYIGHSLGPRIGQMICHIGDTTRKSSWECADSMKTWYLILSAKFPSFLPLFSLKIKKSLICVDLYFGLFVLTPDECSIEYVRLIPDSVSVTWDFRKLTSLATFLWISAILHHYFSYF